MGVLDDAIRQHLELKRAHGADESELRRKEDEALGPARREAPAAPEEEAEAEVQADVQDGEAAPIEEPVAAETPPDPDDPFGGDEPFSDVVAAEPEVEPEPEPEPDVVDGDAVEDLSPADHEPAVSHTPTQGFDALASEEEDPLDEPAAPTSSPDGEEDVLEETPEFLQETPEHDRLWFEQKPPRDFDFDDDK